MWVIENSKKNIIFMIRIMMMMMMMIKIIILIMIITIKEITIMTIIV